MFEQKYKLQFYFMKEKSEIYFFIRKVYSKDCVCSYTEWINKIKLKKDFGINNTFRNLVKVLEIFTKNKCEFEDFSVTEFVGTYYKMIVIESKDLINFFNSYYKFKANSIYEKQIENKLFIIYKKSTHLNQF